MLPRRRRSSVLLTCDEKMYTFRRAVAAAVALAAPASKVKLSEDVWLGVAVRKYISYTVIQWVLAPAMLRPPIPNLVSLSTFLSFFLFGLRKAEKKHKNLKHVIWLILSTIIWTVRRCEDQLNFKFVEFRTYAQIVLLQPQYFFTRCVRHCHHQSVSYSLLFSNNLDFLTRICGNHFKAPYVSAAARRVPAAYFYDEKNSKFSSMILRLIWFLLDVVNQWYGATFLAYYKSNGSSSQHSCRSQRKFGEPHVLDFSFVRIDSFKM